MNNIIKIGDFQFKQETERERRLKEQCEHRKLFLHEDGQYVTCHDCGIQVEAFWALKNLINAYEDAWREIEEAQRRLNEQYKEKRFLKVLNTVDKAWRGKRQNAVCCPHCKKAILPEDGLGDLQSSAILERKRREKLKHG